MVEMVILLTIQSNLCRMIGGLLLLGLSYPIVAQDAALSTPGTATKAGPGQYITAGPGYRQGLWQTYDVSDGLPHNSVMALLEDRFGRVWVGTRGGGVSRYDGEGFVTYTPEDGLAGNAATVLMEDRSGHVWIGNDGGGVSRYDGENFVTYTTEDGLASNQVRCLMEDRSGQIWMGTWGGGVTRYDGSIFQHLSRRDGLANNRIYDLLQDRKDDIWIGTKDGLVRYRPPRVPPPVYLKSIVADRAYGPIREVRIPSTQRLIAFEYLGISHRTRPSQIAYVYRLEGYDVDWQQTRERQVTYTDLPSGEYLFEVKAVDRDLNYSEKPATVKVIVHPPFGLIALW